MKPTNDKQLMRLLHGELAPEERKALEAAMNRSPDLARRYRELGLVWEELGAGPAETGQRPDLASAVLDRALNPSTPAWNQLPSVWRAATLAAAAAGIAAGVVLTPAAPSAEIEPFAAQPSLAASYLVALEEALEQVDDSSESDTEVNP